MSKQLIITADKKGTRLYWPAHLQMAHLFGLPGSVIGLPSSPLEQDKPLPHLGRGWNGCHNLMENNKRIRRRTEKALHFQAFSGDICHTELHKPLGFLASAQDRAVLLYQRWVGWAAWLQSPLRSSQSGRYQRRTCQILSSVFCLLPCSSSRRSSHLCYHSKD